MDPSPLLLPYISEFVCLFVSYPSDEFFIEWLRIYNRGDRKMANPLLILLVVFAGLYVVFCIMITNELRKRGVKINYLLIRVLIIKYIHQYKKITLKETGKVGSLFYPCIVSINLALICAILYLVVL